MRIDVLRVVRRAVGGPVRSSGDLLELVCVSTNEINIMTLITYYIRIDVLRVVRRGVSWLVRSSGDLLS